MTTSGGAPAEPASPIAATSREPSARGGPRGLGAAVPRRSWLSVRWRQFRNAPRPVVRAVGSSLVVALVLGAAYLAYDLSAPASETRGRVLGGVLYVLGVLVAGAVITWLIVPLPRGSGTRATRTGWSAMLGLFAAIPMAYLVLVVMFDVVKPLLT